MSARIARWIVTAAVTVVPDQDARARYREQWLADVDGAAELAVSPTRVALGAAMAAMTLATTSRAAAVPRALQLPRIDPAARRWVGIVQLVLVAPYLWALAFWAYGTMSMGVSGDELMQGGHDPKDLLTGWNPLFWAYVPVVLWIAVGGWMLAVALVPVGAVLSVGGRGSARWVPLAGTVAGIATAMLATSDFGHALRVWLLD
jgi:hypothetical protein